MKKKTARRFLERNKIKLLKRKMSKGVLDKDNSLEKRAKKARKTLEKKQMHYKETKFGFEYGNAKIQRLFSDEKKGWVTISIESEKYKGNNHIQVYITKTGKIRIHSREGEWFPIKKDKEEK